MQTICNIIQLRNGQLCSSSSDRTIKIWNMEEATCVKTLSGHTGPVHALVELPNGILISGGVDQIRFWNLKSTSDNDPCTRIVQLKMMWCFSIILLSYEEIAYGNGAVINICGTIDCEFPIKKLVGHRALVRDLLLHPNGHLISSSEDKTMRMWDVLCSSCIRTFTGNHYCFKMVWFNKDIVATAYRNGEIKLWSIYSGRCVKTLRSQEKAVYGLVVGPKGNLISYGDGTELTFWG